MTKHDNNNSKNSESPPLTIQEGGNNNINCILEINEEKVKNLSSKKDEENIIPISIIQDFDDMDLPEELLRDIYSYGFEKPSAIQKQAINPLRNGHDLIAQAQSGTVRNQSMVNTYNYF